MTDVKEVFDELVDDGKIKFELDQKDIEKMIEEHLGEDLSQVDKNDIENYYQHWKLKKLFDLSKDELDTFSKFKEAYDDQIKNKLNELYVKSLFGEYQYEKKEYKEEKEDKKSELKEIFDRLINDGKIKEGIKPTTKMIEDEYKSKLTRKQISEIENYMKKFMILTFFNKYKYNYEDIDELIEKFNKVNKLSKEHENYFKHLFNNYLKTRITSDQLLDIIKKIPGDYCKLLLHYFDKIVKYDYMSNIFIIIKNQNVPFPIALELFNILNIPTTSPRYSTISDNLSITVSDIKKHPEIQWDYNSLSKNPNITWKFIEETINSIEYQKLDKDKKWDFKYSLSRNPCITFDIVVNNLEYRWGIKSLSENPNITLKIVRDNPELEWDFYSLTKNINIKIKDIIENKDIFKNQKESILGYTYNPNLNIKDVFEYNKLFKGTTWESTCQNPGISIEDIMETPFFPWPLGEMQYNTNFTFKTIIENDKKDNKIFLPFQLSSLLDNKYDGKHKKDVKFPKYWLIVYYLYKYFYNANKSKEEI